MAQRYLIFFEAFYSYLIQFEQNHFEQTITKIRDQEFIFNLSIIIIDENNRRFFFSLRFSPIL